MKMPNIGLVVGVLSHIYLFGSAAAQAGHKCSGMGQRYCNGANFDADECPRLCQRRNCDDVRNTQVISNGVSKYKNIDWIDIVDDGVWDNTYVYGDEICYGVCWYKPWESKCHIWGETDDGKKFCKLLSCKHDRGSRSNGGNRYAGCHYSKRDGDSKGKKKPWHKPTCEECYKVFPACRSQLEGELRSSQKREIDVPRSERGAHSRWDDRKYGDTRKYRKGYRGNDDDDDDRKRRDSSDSEEEKSEVKPVSSEKVETPSESDSQAAVAEAAVAVPASAETTTPLKKKWQWVKPTKKPSTPKKPWQWIPKLNITNTNSTTGPQNKWRSASRAPPAKPTPSWKPMNKIPQQKAKPAWQQKKPQESSASAAAPELKAAGEFIMSREQIVADVNGASDYEDFERLEDTPGEWQVFFDNEVSPAAHSAVEVSSIVMQFAADAEDVEEEILTRAISKIADVQRSAVILLHMVGMGDIAEDSGEKLLTVNFGIISKDPEQTSYVMDTIEEKDMAEFISDETGLKYLKYSKSVDTKFLPQAMVVPEASQNAKIVEGKKLAKLIATDKFTSVEINSAPGTGKLLAIITSAVVSLGALFGVAFIAMKRIVARRSTPSAEPLISNDDIPKQQA